MGPSRSRRTRALESIPGISRVEHDSGIQHTSGTRGDTDEYEKSAISCEACRQRKCKCDRKIPCCSQCSSDPYKCTYPRRGKRGLPMGYLTQLEKRLAETEASLYMTLTALGTTRPSTMVSVFPADRPDQGFTQKSARMNEWSHYPLHGGPELDRWMTAVSDRFTVKPLGKSGTAYDRPIPDDVELGTSQELRGLVWRDETHMEGPYETQSRGLDSSPTFCHQVEPSGSRGIPSQRYGAMGGDIDIEDGQSQADILSKSKPCIYF